MPEQLNFANKKRGEAKFARIALKQLDNEVALKKPEWLRVRVSYSENVNAVKSLLRELKLHSVCEEASCPNLSECFSAKTATFMIMGDICTRRCAFCDVAHGRPLPLDHNEPHALAQAIQRLKLQYVVITSVDRDDLKDAGASHFAACIDAISAQSPFTQIEILVPDFRNRLNQALEALSEKEPKVFNHNIETVPSLYKKVRPGARYDGSLALLDAYKKAHPNVITKSGLMLGIGETDEELFEVMADLRAQKVDMLTIGHYLPPTRYHLPVKRWVSPEEFEAYATYAYQLGFSQVASGPFVRSSYHAERYLEDQQNAQRRD